MFLSCAALQAVTWIDEGMVKRIRGVTFSARVSTHSPGYGISLVAETTSGCFVSADTAVSYAREDDVTEIDDEKKELLPPADTGEQIASVLLQEIEQGVVVDSRHQVCVVSALYYLFVSVDWIP
ncbi:hypothetical protein Tsubulata_042055 [Turnera subulata]|uniref:RNA 3'-terminal phosphate cyclase insert domain-containing protein n=1 Tax=Turnera subulata TaxID=218843 RepID=A0A9Q0FLX0_9ROSI|nr:hypothetical protein Tsubulata_042055 [Turnera subulata]